MKDLALMLEKISNLLSYLSKQSFSGIKNYIIWIFWESIVFMVLQLIVFVSLCFAIFFFIIQKVDSENSKMDSLLMMIPPDSRNSCYQAYQDYNKILNNDFKDTTLIFE